MELVIDSFAGGGGASTGIRDAFDGRPVDIAINHAEAAIAMHRVNHPETRHYCESIWEVDPAEATRGKRVRAAWFSPDCTHFSRAKGGRPRSKEVRGLAGVVIEWAKRAKPAVIFLENVREFQDWGPLDDEGHPIESRKGEDFRAWLAELHAAGYPTIEYRLLRADRYGAPTTRERLFLVARRDGQRVVWPEPTHGPGLAPVRTAAEVIDWSLPCPSIFGRRRPLADATLRRIAAGLKRYVIESADPFIVPVKTWGGGGNDARGIDEPMRTVTASKRGEFALVTPYINTQFGQSVGRNVDAPLPTITGGGMGHQALVAPTLVNTGYGERPGQRPRALDPRAPLGTVVSGGKHALVSAFLAKHFTQPEGRVHAGISCEVPVGTVTARDHHSLVTAHLEKFYGTAEGADVRAPLPTVTASGQHIAEVRAFLVKYYGDSDTQRQRCDRPLDVVTTKARFGLVTVAGVEYQIVDIGLRMLTPRELFNAQGFPADYVIDFDMGGRPITKTRQIELCGNSVCPTVARALVAANVHERYEPRMAA